MAAHPISSHSHNAADLAAVLTNTNTTLRNASLLSALALVQQLPAMFVEAEDQRPVLEMDGDPLAFSHLIPIVDMSLLKSSDPAVRASPVADIAAACEKFGFFQVVNHGVDESLIRRCETEAHTMFELPLDVKERVHRPPGTSFGYGANTWVNQTVMHWAESFHMQLHPKSNIREFSGKLFAESDPTKFSSTVEEYMGQIEKLARQLLELLTEGLGLEPTTFNHYVENERMMSMRFNLYPPCPQPELAIGLRAHTDPHLLTILHQDEVAGLQVHIDEKWITVKPRPDCFVVNVGDLFQVLSNTRYKSVLHRAAVNGTSKRLSLACFLNPPLSATVEAPPELITAERPQVYRPFTWGEYLSNAYKFHPAMGGERHERFFLERS
uniref:GA20 oxidase-like protein n=1 Tax=Physcomitrium patens TaxID=3218 RepID=B3XXH1_PHYPA|nr:GA20 oxidase-like protein [Physcomitrium patens]